MKQRLVSWGLCFRVNGLLESKQEVVWPATAIALVVAAAAAMLGYSSEVGDERMNHTQKQVVRSNRLESKCGTEWFGLEKLKCCLIIV